MSAPAVFVVNLARCPERRVDMAARCAAAGLTPTFVTAVDGAQLGPLPPARYLPARARRLHGRELSPGELGCQLSHEGLWRRVLDAGLPWALVLEDDVELAPDVGAALADVAALTRPWELVRLAATRARRGRAVQPLSGGRQLVRLAKGGMGTQAYAVSAAGARKLLAQTERIDYPVDEAMDRYWESGLDVYALWPYPVRDDPRYGSTIAAPGTRRLTPARGLERAAYRARRLGSSLQRRWYTLRTWGLW